MYEPRWNANENSFSCADDQIEKPNSARSQPGGTRNLAGAKVLTDTNVFGRYNASMHLISESARVYFFLDKQRINRPE
jgi:hypothetical protein